MINIWMVIIAIAIISVVLAVFSLKSLVDKSHLRQAKKKLSEGRVIFQDTSSSSKE